MGYLVNAFKKATLTAALATTLVAGAGQSAFAQSAQAGPPPQPDAQSEQVRVPSKPWANDPTYRRQVEAYEKQMEARERQYKAQEKAQFAQLNGNYQIQQANLIAQYPAYQKQGWQGLVRFQALETQISTQYNANRIAYKSNWDAVYAREDAAHEQYVLNLDLQYGRLPQYQNKTPTTQTVTSPAVRQGVSLTPEQQHDRLVKAYQDAQLQSAQSGGKIPMPDPAKYGLDPKDPAIQPVRR